MQDIDKVALARILGKHEKDNSREAVVPGTYPIDFALRVAGTVTVGVDYKSKPTTSIPLLETIAAFIVHAGIVVSDATSQALVAALTDSIANTGKGKGAISAAMPMVQQALARVQSEIIDKLPKVDKKGVVTTELNITELEPQLV